MQQQYVGKLRDVQFFQLVPLAVEKEKVSYMSLPGAVRKLSFDGYNADAVIMVEKVISEYFSLTLKDIRGRKRFRSYVVCRQIIWHFLRKYSRMSFADIGNRFNRDHTTILLGLRTVRDLIETDDALRCDVEKIEKLIEKYYS